MLRAAELVIPPTVAVASVGELEVDKTEGAGKVLVSPTEMVLESIVTVDDVAEDGTADELSEIGVAACGVVEVIIEVTVFI